METQHMNCCATVLLRYYGNAIKDLTCHNTLNKASENKNELHTCNVSKQFLYYRESVLKGHIAFAENGQKSAYVICSYGTPG
jgi:hypothetical protein